MKRTAIIMGMPVTIVIEDIHGTSNDIEDIFAYFKSIDDRFSTYRHNSEISKINRGELAKEQYSEQMKEIFALSEQTKKQTYGYFDIQNDTIYDPSGLVKGWAIYQAFSILKKRALRNFFIEAGGDIQVYGKNKEGKPWQVGIRDPFRPNVIVKIVQVTTEGVATSGTYSRGQHIYNPHNRLQKNSDITSVTVIGSTIYEADRFATAAFAMGKKGIHFIEKQKGLEGYMIDSHGIATMTSHFNDYTKT